jgi:hypothetical protein
VSYPYTPGFFAFRPTIFSPVLHLRCYTHVIGFNRGSATVFFEETSSIAQKSRYVAIHPASAKSLPVGFRQKIALIGLQSVDFFNPMLLHQIFSRAALRAR